MGTVVVCVYSGKDFSGRGAILGAALQKRATTKDMKTRTSTQQIARLLQHIELASQADHPLSEIYREFVKDVLLDLRDLRGEEAKLQWQLQYMRESLRLATSALEKAQTQLESMKGEGRLALRSQLHAIGAFLVQAQSKHPDSHVEQEAIFPLTGKER